MTSLVWWLGVGLVAEAPKIYFDDELIRKDGRFVTAHLEALNPELLRSRASQPSKRSTA